MWGATEKMARKIIEGLTDAGVSIKLFNINTSDRTEVIKEMFEAQGYIIGSSSHDNTALPTISGFLEFLKGLKPKNRIACAFGSYGWAGGAVNHIENVLKEAGINISQPSLSVKYIPDENEMRRCYKYGLDFAKALVKNQ